MDDPRPVILFDGDCNFCNTTVRRILLPASSKRRKTWVLMTSDRETEMRRSARCGYGMPAYPACLSRRTGGAKGNRTPDLYNAIVALYQLSYGPGIGNTAAGMRRPHCEARGGAVFWMPRWIPATTRHI